MSCQGRHDAVLLLALEGLDAAESAALRAHLADCAVCRGLLEEAEALAVELDGELPAEEPPAAVLERLREHVAAHPTRDAPVAAQLAPAASPWPARIAAGIAIAALSATATWMIARSGDPAAAAERAALELRIASLEEERQRAGEAIEEARDEMGELDDEMATLELQLAEAREQIALLASAGVVVMELAGSESMPGAEARVFWEWEDYLCYLRAKGLPRPAAGSQYVLWLEREAGGFVRAGALEYQGAGEGMLWVQLPRETGRAVNAVVTLEPMEAEKGKPSGPVQLKRSDA